MVWLCPNTNVFMDTEIWTEVNGHVLWSILIFFKHLKTENSVFDELHRDKWL